MATNHSTLVGTAGGTLLSIVPNIYSADVLKTVILAALGAVISFVISLVLKLLLKQYKK
ncbi:MAG: hypothetical protein H7199_08410 [Burkholderiales bacterium]|nr:hypothetical protein [Flavobacterium sp.]